MKKIINPWRRSVEGRLQGKNHEGYNCFGCSPDNPIGLHMEFYEDGDYIVSTWHPQHNYQGWVDTMHGINIRIAHYPPYCSKWNPIEHRLFSQISRTWSGAVFNTVEEASELASRTRTKSGLAVFTSINRGFYETKKARNPLFQSECDRYIVKDEILPKWNNLVKCNR